VNLCFLHEKVISTLIDVYVGWSSRQRGKVVTRSMKATAVAHPIQGLVKYHGLRDPKLRIPFHDSISVCVQALRTTTTVTTAESLEEDSVKINGKMAVNTDLERVKKVLNELRGMTDYSGHFRIVSENNVTVGKGLGFSASGFAALGLAACAALDFSIDYLTLSELVRLGAGSSTRSLAGSFAIWYANRDRKSYAEQIVKPDAVGLGMVIVPISSPIKTDEAHTEVLSSPLFKARLKHVRQIIKRMENAIRSGDVATIGKLAEEDTLNLHASTMTGKAHMVLWEPETVRIIKEVENLRRDGVPAWYSMDTGPSVFVNTFEDRVERVACRLREIGCTNLIISGVGDRPFLSTKHLF
jgi:phosphomevalonate decarboxylase